MSEDSQKRYVNFPDTATREKEIAIANRIVDKYDDPIESVSIKDGVAEAHYMEKGYSRSRDTVETFSYDWLNMKNNHLQEYASNVIRAASMNGVKVKKVVVRVSYD